jgi:hypothetical protein
MFSFSEQPASFMCLICLICLAHFQGTALLLCNPQLVLGLPLRLSPVCSYSDLGTPTPLVEGSSAETGLAIVFSPDLICSVSIVSVVDHLHWSGLTFPVLPKALMMCFLDLTFTIPSFLGGLGLETYLLCLTAAYDIGSYLLSLQLLLKSVYFARMQAGAVFLPLFLPSRPIVLYP